MGRLPKLLTGTLVAFALAVAPAAAQEGPPIDLSRASTCDFIAEPGPECMLPFPNDYYTVRDKGSRTGRRIAFQDAAMPQNTAGQPITAAPYNLNDGFSPGQTAVLRIPGLDNPQALAATNPVGLANLGAYKRKKAPVVVIDAKTGERWPIWAEIDSNADTPEETAFLIHPAVNYAAKHRYVVALRNLKTETGATIPAPAGFRYYRDELESSEAVINKRRNHFEKKIFAVLAEAGIKRRSLYLAWDFTVASDQNIAERSLFMRNDAFRQLGDRKLTDLKVKGATSPFTVSTVTEFNPCGSDGCEAGEDLYIQRRVQGTFTVPCYLAPNCGPGSRFALDAKGLPTRNGDYTTNFDCVIPRVTADTPGAAAGNRPVIYGHGLLGDAGEVMATAQRSLAQAHRMVTCATDTVGFSESDVPNIVTLLQNLGDFPEIPDRTQQGILNTLLLGRMMIHPQGLSSHPAFRVNPADPASASTINRKRLYYNGNSQGGIIGGAVTALAPDFTRASLGVPAMNYSVLLQRSVDYDLYGQILEPSYPSPFTQSLALAMIQMLWDRSEANGYAHRMTTKTLAGTPQHEVLMNVAFGDHQVTTWQADVEARTIGAYAHRPVVYPGRWAGVKELWGIPRIKKYPFRGSAIVYWDNGPPRTIEGTNTVIGTDPPPIENLPNRSGDDPHGEPRVEPEEQQMVSDFLRPDKKSKITNTCKPTACFSGGFAGP